MWRGDFFEDSSRALILLDTEGLDDPEKGNATHDTNMFSLALLISSVFIYNTKGTIDAKSLDGLHFAAEMSSFVRSDSRNAELLDGENLASHFPAFIWAIRDHHLKLELDGEDCTSGEYLEHLLKNKQGMSPAVVQYNLLRNSLRAFFPDRTCCVFPPPVNNPDLMNFLDTLPDTELTTKFTDAGQSLLIYLLID
jgi:hypothetical protein